MSDTLQQLLEDNGYETRSYSGRGMYGKSCLAITVDDPIVAALEIGIMIGKSGAITCNYGSRVRQDQMGLNYVLYWSSVPYEESADDEDEEESANV